VALTLLSSVASSQRMTSESFMAQRGSLYSQRQRAARLDQFSGCPWQTGLGYSVSMWGRGQK
jgi:hypothetical protein